MGENFDKLTNFVGKIGNEISNTANNTAKRTGYILDVVKDKAGNTVGLIKDRAGNVVRTVTDNLDKIVNGLRFAGSVLVCGLMVGSLGACNMGVGTSVDADTIVPATPGVDLENVDGIEVQIIDANSSQQEVTDAITQSVKDLCREITDMRTNIARYRAVREQGYSDGLPSEAFLHSVDEFHTGLFSTGHTAINNMVSTLGDNVGGNKDLLVSYINALRGMAYLGTKNNTNSNYAAAFSLGSGTVSVGSLIQDVNNKNAAADTDYPLSGIYPITGINSNAVHLLQEPYYAIGSGIIAEIVNFEKFLAFMERAAGLGKNTTLSREALNAITVAFGGVADNTEEDELEDAANGSGAGNGTGEKENEGENENDLEDAGNSPDVGNGTEDIVGGQDNETNIEQEDNTNTEQGGQTGDNSDLGNTGGLANGNDDLEDAGDGLAVGGAGNDSGTNAGSQNQDEDRVGAVPVPGGIGTGSGSGTNVGSQGQEEDRVGAVSVPNGIGAGRE